MNGQRWPRWPGGGVSSLHHAGHSPRSTIIPCHLIAGCSTTRRLSYGFRHRAIPQPDDVSLLSLDLSRRLFQRRRRGFCETAKVSHRGASLRYTRERQATRSVLMWMHGLAVRPCGSCCPQAAVRAISRPDDTSPFLPTLSCLLWLHAADPHEVVFMLVLDGLEGGKKGFGFRSR